MFLYPRTKGLVYRHKYKPTNIYLSSLQLNANNLKYKGQYLPIPETLKYL